MVDIFDHPFTGIDPAINTKFDSELRVIERALPDPLRIVTSYTIVLPKYLKKRSEIGGLKRAWKAYRGRLKLSLREGTYNPISMDTDGRTVYTEKPQIRLRHLIAICFAILYVLSCTVSFVYRVW